MTAASPWASSQYMQSLTWPETFRQPTHDEWMAEVTYLFGLLLEVVEHCDCGPGSALTERIKQTVGVKS